jgi:hypothetical protein
MATEMIKTGAVLGAIEGVTDAAVAYTDVRQKIDEADSEVEYKINENNLTAAFEELKNDPNLDKEVQDDGTTTPDYLQREADALLKTYKQSISKIKDPAIRKRAEQFSRNREQLMRVEVAAESRDIGIKIAGDKLFTGFTDALNRGDIPGASDLIQTGVDRGLLGVELAEKWREAAETTRIQLGAAEQVAFVNEGFAVSDDEGQERLSALIKDTTLDVEVRDLAIDGAEEKASEWGKARSKEREQAEVNAIISYGDDVMRAKNGQLSFEEIDASFKSNKYGKGTGAATRRNQLYAAVEASVVKQENMFDVGEMIRNNQFIPNDTKSRTALSDYEMEVTEGMEQQDAIRLIGDISRTAGTTSTRTTNALNLAARSEQAAGQVLPLYRELTSDKGLHPDMHLNTEAKAFLEHASTLMGVGLSQEEAVTTAWAAKPQNLTETQKIDRGITWNNEGVDAVNDAFGELLDADMYEDPWFGYDVEEPPQAMATEYGQVYKAVFNTTGDMETAKTIADQTTMKNWVKTNLNSAEPDEYTIEKYGIPGDSRQIRAAKIKELENNPMTYALPDGTEKTIENVKYRIEQPDGTYKNSTIDPEAIKFIPKTERADAFDADGNQVFFVEHNGKPLTVVTEDGLLVVEKSIDRTKIDAFRKAESEREQMEQRIKDIEKEEKRLDAKVEGNPYHIANTPGIARRSKERLSGLGKEKAKLKESLPKQVHF